jgi:signal transduction histidine kinase
MASWSRRGARLRPQGRHAAHLQHTTRLGDDAALGFVTVARDLTAQRDAADALARATAGVEAHVAQRTEDLQREEECARMARDLHEQLGAQVSALRVVLEQLRDRSTAQQPAEATLTQALQLTHALSSKVDFLASGLRRPAR